MALVETPRDGDDARRLIRNVRIAYAIPLLYGVWFLWSIMYGHHVLPRWYGYTMLPQVLLGFPLAGYVAHVFQKRVRRRVSEYAEAHDRLVCPRDCYPLLDNDAGDNLRCPECGTAYDRATLDAFWDVFVSGSATAHLGIKPVLAPAETAEQANRLINRAPLLRLAGLVLIVSLIALVLLTITNVRGFWLWVHLGLLVLIALAFLAADHCDVVARLRTAPFIARHDHLVCARDMRPLRIDEENHATCGRCCTRYDPDPLRENWRRWLRGATRRRLPNARIDT